MDVLFAFALTLFAGVSTGIGSLIAFFSKKNNHNFLAITLGFSAGVMLYVSMIEILDKANTSISSELGENLAGWITALAFFLGMIFIAILDKLLPKEKDVYQLSSNKKKKQYIKNSKLNVAVGFDDVNSKTARKKAKLLRIGVFTAVAIAIHNFPEGLATFMSALQDASIAIPIAVAIALHNIPEGIAVAMPVYYATGNRKKAFWLSFASGLTEPLGAIIGYLILLPIMSDLVFGIIFAGVAGMMVFISLDELLPSAREYGKPYLSIYGLIGGMVIMAVSLLLFM